MKLLTITALLFFVPWFSIFASVEPENTKQEFEQAIASNIQDLSNWVKATSDKAGDFLSEQTPLYIQEYINWVFYSNLFWSIYGTALLVIFIAIFCISLKISSKHDWDDEFKPSMPITIASGLLLFFIFLHFCVQTTGNIQNCIQAKAAPRVLIVEHIKSFVR
jgi:hypothetical protein